MRYLHCQKCINACQCEKIHILLPERKLRKLFFYLQVMIKTAMNNRENSHLWK